jgi:hypothetical protein
MSSKPTVTATLAGDESDLTRAFDKVGQSADQMESKVSESSRGLNEAGNRFDSLAESTDTAETRFTGFYDTIGGTRDALAAWNDESLSTTDRLVALGQAGADLAGGLTGFLIPALGSIWTTLTGTVIPAVWSFTAALLANPITWIVLGIAALIGILYLLGVRWDDVKNIVGNVVGWIVDRWNGLMNWFSGIPGWFGKIFSGIGNAIAGAFKSAINWVIDRLNWLVDRANDLIYGINVISPFNDIPNIPHIPRMHTGGVVQGRPGQEVPIMAMAGERIESNVGGASGAGMMLLFGGNVDSAMASAIQHLVTIGELELVPA